MSSKDVADFYELRQGLQGIGARLQDLVDFQDAALRFLDRNGIALQAKKNGNGNGNGHARPSGRPPGRNGKRRIPPGVLEQVKRTYTRRATVAPPPLDIQDVPSKPRKMTSAEKKLETRRRSAAILDSLDRTEPRQPPEGMKMAMGALVRRGYAKKKGAGYIRTAKVFVPEEGHATAPPRETSSAASADASDALTVAEAAKIIGVSDSYVRLMVKQGKLAAHTEPRARRGGRGISRPMPTMVLTRDEVAHYVAQQA